MTKGCLRTSSLAIAVTMTQSAGQTNPLLGVQPLQNGGGKW